MGDQPCPPRLVQTCVKKEECPEIIALYHKAETEEDSQLKSSLIAELKSKVCSREEQKFHCTLSAGQRCLGRAECSSVLGLYDRLRQERNSTKRNSTIAQLKSLVCNKEEKKFCCPPPDPTDPTTPTDGTFLP